MCHRMKLLKRSAITFLTLLGADPRASAFLIEDFSQADSMALLVFNASSPGSYVEAASGTMSQGERDFGFVTSGGTWPGRFGRELSSGIMRIWAQGLQPGQGGVDALMFLQYDGQGDEVGNTGFGHNLNNLGIGQRFLPANSGGIRIKAFPYGDHVQLGVTLRSSGSVIAHSVITTPDEYDPRYFLFPFSPSDLGATDSVTIEVGASAFSQHTYGISILQIDTIVPEPGMLLSIGVGLSWFALRKRR